MKKFALPLVREGRKIPLVFSFLLMAGLSLLLVACDRQKLPATPVQVCQSVSTALLGFSVSGDVKVSEQEIHGERIVVHLAFKRPQDSLAVKTVCVYGFDRYNDEGKQQLYRQVPTRMAVNGTQISELELLAAIKKAGFADKW